MIILRIAGSGVKIDVSHALALRVLERSFNVLKDHGGTLTEMETFTHVDTT